jgi:hypothetical protein
VHTLNVGIAGGYPAYFYTINGVLAPQLTLNSGTPYTLVFNIPSPVQFVLAASSVFPAAMDELTSTDVPGYVPGGACVDGCVSRTMTLKPDMNTVSQFFYECATYQGCGNLVTITP